MNWVAGLGWVNGLRRVCMICRRREIGVLVRGGGEICHWCAQDVPLDMLPEGYPQ